jgi:phage-related protein
VKDSVNILHSFTKKSNKTPKLDLDLATKRLKNLKAREQEKKRKAK